MTTVTSAELAHKKRKRRTLDDFFSPLTAKKQEDYDKNDANRNNLLFSYIPRHVILRSIFPFLTVQDLTTLSFTCHFAASIVDCFRGPLPYIVREELLPYKIQFRNSRYDTADDYEVYQARRVRFLLKTKLHRVVQVNINISKYLWTEKESLRRWIASYVPQGTNVSVQIFKQIKYSDGSIRRVSFFETKTERDEDGDNEYDLENLEEYPLDPDGCLIGFDELKYYTEPIEYVVYPPSVTESLRCATKYIWPCFNRVAASPPKYNLPSLHHLIKHYLPTIQYQYLPSEFQLDDLKGKQGPKDFPLWKFREWPAVSARREFFGYDKNPRTRKHINENEDVDDWLIKEYFIHDIPWYREWYPKPVLLNPKNLLASLPAESVFVNWILPHLSQKDIASLVVVCPNLIAEMLDLFRKGEA
jgi:hypothetical protein